MRKSPMIALILAAFTLSACETVKGAGQDISNAGEAITEESQDVQNDL
ncbi:putative small secreted protein [Yoonia maritima]|uniref:Putative small secreted protein n=1 Tax=Yoonia maritima TaxID=1435347 RepID=A0A2T0W3J8_9RHOB|nr:entericidin A/B family lipoprotein [Yoonia maritima]PRY79587.1 putative small secreted protein [Yoonia maritima]